jgi:hypothetical protein
MPRILARGLSCCRLVAYLASEEAVFVSGANIAINRGQHL